MADQQQPAQTLVGPAVSATIKALTLTPADAGAVQLATRYAQAIDEAADLGGAQEALDRLGPKLLAALESLGATPAARARITKGSSTPAAGPSKLQQMRDARRK